MKTFREHLIENNIIEQSIIEESYIQDRKAKLVEEAAFADKDLVKALRLVVKVINKRCGTNFVFSPLPEFYTIGGDEKTGYMAFAKSGKDAIRLNVNEKVKTNLAPNKEPGWEVTSLDVYDGSQVNPKSRKATVHIDLGGVNIIKALDYIAEAITNPADNTSFEELIEVNTGESFEKVTIDLHEESINVWKPKTKVKLVEEKVTIGGETFRTIGAAVEKLIELGWESKRIQAEIGASPAQVSQALRKLKMAGVVTGMPGKQEVNISAESLLPPIPKKVPVETLFRHLRELVTLVIVGQSQSLIVTGQAGIGKCISADTELKVKIKE